MDEITQIEHIFLWACQSNTVRIKFFKMECGEDETADQYMDRCQKMMAEKLGYPIINGGYRDFCGY
jgi:hypothetical protein